MIRNFILGLVVGAGLVHGTSAASQPNIVLVMADDVSPDMFSCYAPLTPYGMELAANTPNIDKLAETGVAFKTAYASAMCGPSRAQIMTGKYGSTTGALQNGLWLNGSRETIYSNHLAFGKMMSEAGYATAIAGKWHAGSQMPYEADVGFQEYCLWEGAKEVLLATGQELKKSDCAWEDESTPSRYWKPCLVQNGELLKVTDDDFCPDLCCDFICDFMERQSKAGKPFLAYWPTVSPHGTRSGQPTNPLRGNPGDLGTKGDKDNGPRFKSLIEHMDSTIGRIQAKVKELGIENNTVIIFCSDNGTAVTAKTRGVERGCHVVFMAAGARIKQRGLTDELMDFSDIAPTLADYAGIEAKQTVPYDGISLKPFLTGKVDQTKPLIHGFISTSQLVRSKDHLLEVYNPMLGMPDGRFYYTGENRFCKGYGRVDSNPEHAAAKNQFFQYLEQYPAMTADHPHWQTKAGKKFYKSYTSPKEKEKHLHNHKDYTFYDEN
ncbi:sulfatase-like hydrolase/transferase [Pontiella sulfatireligans]|uniref:Arylsulfatase n=1 Tax=Pontiella sulfatireligans TaxID=2750658 RepID=A0A6C2UIP7_9BACT|nr:sulfatase-like hydrolase/transferase [Pontiella sulfatireligans]SPS74318.1 sulfatase S1_24 [Kiritimatiellales bacterium]VGO19327.1 Arylsulfatase [Pontiella sulfatireligans]